MIMLLIDEVKKCESSYEIISKPVVLSRDLYIFWRIGDEEFPKEATEESNY